MLVETDNLTLDLCQEDLYERLGWFVRLRWLVVVGLFATIVAARFGLGISFAVLPLFILDGVLVLCNAVYLLLWRQWRNASIGRLSRFGIVQTIVDYIILTVVLHYSGGVENPLIVTFVFQCIIAGMLFRPGLSYVLAGVAMLLACGMVALELTSVWPHCHVTGYLSGEFYSRPIYVAGVLFTLGIVLGVSVYLTTTIETTSRNRRREAAKRSQELDEAREQIQQADKMAALGELAASMAHDINNPAGVICSRLDVMEAEKVFDNLPDRLRRDLLTLRECAQYLRRVAENWTSFARKRAPNIGSIDLNEAVRGTIEMVAESLASQGIRLHLSLHDSPIWVHGDMVRLQQTLLNLVNNARDAMRPEGTLTIRTRLEPDSSGPPRALLEVEDTGTGIAPEDLDRIFQPLFSRKPPGQGTGLGLAICQKIVREMDGEIQVESRLGRGSVFSIYLPARAFSTRTTNHAHV
jgi:signal transduction histidine kinase